MAHVKAMGHRGSYPSFVGHGADSIVLDYTGAFSKLVKIYDSEASSNRQVNRIEDRMWDDDALPRIGSARVSDLPAEADESPGGAS